MKTINKIHFLFFFLCVFLFSFNLIAMPKLFTGSVRRSLEDMTKEEKITLYQNIKNGNVDFVIKFLEGGGPIPTGDFLFNCMVEAHKVINSGRQQFYRGGDSDDEIDLFFNAVIAGKFDLVLNALHESQYSLIDILMNDNKTVLYCAVENKNAAVVMLLVFCGAPLFSTNNFVNSNVIKKVNEDDYSALQIKRFINYYVNNCSYCFGHDYIAPICSLL